MRPLPFVLAVCLTLGGVGSALAARPSLTRLPSAIAVATPGTGSAPVLSAGIDAGAAVTAILRKRSSRRARGTRLGASGSF